MVEKVNICMSKDILEKLDEAARESNMSRSALISQAVRHFLEEEAEEKKRQQKREAVQSIRKIAETLGVCLSNSKNLKEWGTNLIIRPKNVFEWGE